MIDSLPLDLFGDDELEATPQPREESPATATCPWCAATIASDAATCPECGARILPVEPPPPVPHEGICQWCGATITPDIDACLACGWDARGENGIEMPGITTPLSETQVRSLYSGDDQESDTGEAIALVAEIIGAFLPRG